MNTTLPKPRKIEHVQDNLLIGRWLPEAGSAFTGRVWKLLRVCLGGNPQDRKTCHGFHDEKSLLFQYNLSRADTRCSDGTRIFTDATEKHGSQLSVRIRDIRA